MDKFKDVLLDLDDADVRPKQIEDKRETHERFDIPD